MNIILLTILLTVLGVCLVVYFTWLGIASYQLMKFKKKAEGSFKHLERWIEDNHIIMNKKFDETYQFINERDNVFHQRVNNDVVELDKKIDSRVDKSIDMLTKEIDLKYQLMKETQNKLDDLWKAVENINNLKITK